MFCKTEFMKHNFPDVLHEDYTTANGLHWICDDCFNDFQPMFRWNDCRSSTQRSPDCPREQRLPAPTIHSSSINKQFV